MVAHLENVAALLRIRSERLSTVGVANKNKSKALDLPTDVVTISEDGRKRAVAKAVAGQIVQELTSGKDGVEQ